MHVVWVKVVCSGCEREEREKREKDKEREREKDREREREREERMCASKRVSAREQEYLGT